MFVVILLFIIFIMFPSEVDFKETTKYSAPQNIQKTLELTGKKKDQPKKRKFHDEPGVLSFRFRRSREKNERNEKSDLEKTFLTDPLKIIPPNVTHIPSCTQDGQRIFVDHIQPNKENLSSDKILKDESESINVGVQKSIETQDFETQAVYIHTIVEDSTSQTEECEKQDHETQFNASLKIAETQCIEVEKSDVETQASPDTTPTGTITSTSALDDTATQTDVQLKSVPTMTMVNPTSTSETQTETYESHDAFTNTLGANLEMFELCHIRILPTKKILSDAETSTDALLSLSENKSSIMGNNNSSIVLDEHLDVSDESMPHLVWKDMKVSGLNRPTAFKKSLSLESSCMDEKISLELSKSAHMNNKSNSFEDLNESDSSKFSILAELKKSVVFPKLHHIHKIEDMREPDLISIPSSESKKSLSSFSDLNENEVPNLSGVKTVRSSFKSECSDDNEV